ncbi:MAG: twin-arginine translocase TatA/TatE family subunit [Prolixibacteraceae bacterium]|jgi:sec-independent protein translocase protein TatA|nr:twin-arginine translocase TatA/TatE family subunit [Prolixibacteraceae bacterium]
MNLFIIAGIIGPWQVVLIVAIALLLFGGKKIPELMKGVGQGMKEFKKSLSSDDNEDKKENEKEKEKLEK